MDRIQLRRDTAARWSEINPVLLEGEVGYETDTKLRKIGDGVTKWNSLPYLRAEGIVQTTGDSENEVMSQKSVSEKLAELGTNIANQKNEIADFKDAITDQVENYKPIVINGDVTNAADEEDVTSEDNLLKLKDRSSLDGMGYVIVRKGKSFKRQVEGKPNTIFEIRYETNIGEDVVLPQNCILNFNGGKIVGVGTITGNKTSVRANYVGIFAEGIQLAGEWVGEAYPEWFGAKGDGLSDDRPALQKAFNSPFKTLRLYGNYIVKSVTDSTNGICLSVPANKTIAGTSKMAPYVDGQTYTIKVEGVTPKIVLKLSSYCNISGVSIDGNSRTDSAIQQVGIYSNKADLVSLRDCAVIHTYYGYKLCGFEQVIEQCCAGYVTIGFNIRGIYSGDTLSAENTSTTLFNCYVGNSLREAYLCEGMTYSNILTCAADHCGIPDNDSEILTNSNTYPVYSVSNCNNLCVTSCGAEQLSKAYKLESCSCISIRNCRLDYGTSRQYDSSYNYSKTVIDFRYSAGCALEGLRANSLPDANKLMYVEHVYNSIALTITNCHSIAGIFNKMETAGGNEFAVKKIIDVNNIGIPKFGFTSERPSSAPWGFCFFDHNLSKPVYRTYAGTWVDATGTTV